MKLVITVTVIVVATLTSLIGIRPISPALADSYGYCYPPTGCRADNFEHTYCFGATMAGNGFQSAAGYGMTNLVNQTRFIKTFMANCSANTDVVFKRNDDMYPYIGRYNCLDWVGTTNKCNRARVEFNGSLLKNTLNKKKTACHEIGHTGGLAHSGNANDCMINGLVSSGHVHYNAHHVAHLNHQN